MIFAKSALHEVLIFHIGKRQRFYSKGTQFFDTSLYISQLESNLEESEPPAPGQNLHTHSPPFLSTKLTNGFGGADILYVYSTTFVTVVIFI